MTLTARRALGAVAALATLPYIALKVTWLAGHPVGIDPAVLTAPGMVAMNAATLLLDTCVIALATALGTRRALRLPAVAVLLPGWIATGLLVPIVLVSLPLTLMTPAAAAVGMDGWVRPMVYGGFTVQASCLLTSFALYAKDRWGRRVTRPGPVPEAVRPLLRATAGGGTVTAALAAALYLVSAGPDLLATAVPVLLIMAGPTGVVTLARGRSGVLVVAAAWTGSAVAFAGGLYRVSTTMGATALAGSGSAADGMAHVTSLLAGFALAVAALLAVSATAAPSDAHRTDHVAV